MFGIDNNNNHTRPVSSGVRLGLNKLSVKLYNCAAVETAFAVCKINII